MSHRFLSTLLALLGSTLAAQAAYRIENIPLPSELHGGITGVSFTPRGSLVVVTRHGEIWMRSPDGESWRRFARGLAEPMGVHAESETVVYVAHRPELLRASDTDGDGVAETFDVVGGQWGMTNNYHEFFYGLPRDPAGNFYGAASLGSTGEKGDMSRARGERDLHLAAPRPGHTSEVPYRGWVLQITPDGKTVPFASGFRQANGLGVSPDGDLFVTDNQGDYKPSSGLMHVERGDFHGHAESLKWETGYAAGTLTPEVLWQRYKPQAVTFPHGAMGVSPGEPVWDLTGGRFGPFANQVFVGDYSKLVLRVMLEKIAGAQQGAVFAFLGRNESAPFVTGDPFTQGNIRMAFAPDGSLYIGKTGGWGAGIDALQRVSWDGTVPPEIHTMKITDRGFALTFTVPMDRATLADSASYDFTRFRLYYHVKYGSPWIDEERVPVREVIVAPDGRHAEVVLSEMRAGFIYELSVPRLRTTDGVTLANPIGYYTANRLPSGEIAPGGVTRLAEPGETSRAANEVQRTPAALVAAGERVYKLYCAACHQPNGEGIVGGAAKFVGANSPLAKSDEELLASIVNGLETKGMPAFGSSINVGQQRAVLAYLRAAFGETADRPQQE